MATRKEGLILNFQRSEKLPFLRIPTGIFYEVIEPDSITFLSLNQFLGQGKWSNLGPHPEVGVGQSRPNQLAKPDRVEVAPKAIFFLYYYQEYEAKDTPIQWT